MRYLNISEQDLLVTKTGRKENRGYPVIPRMTEGCQMKTIQVLNNERTPKSHKPLNPLKTLKSSLNVSELTPFGRPKIKELKINEPGLFGEDSNNYIKITKYA